jgi:hypothetical protein
MSIAVKSRLDVAVLSRIRCDPLVFCFPPLRDMNPEMGTGKLVGVHQFY